MANDESHIDDQYNLIGKNLVIDLPPWLEKAVEQKNPLVTLDLAYSILLVYDEVDKYLLALATLN